MEKKDKNQEFDPEKNKEVKKGPLKPKHKNQYGESSGQSDTNSSRRVGSDEEEE